MMATESYKRCDVTGSRKGVKAYNILVVEIDEDDSDNSHPIMNITKDLCPRIVRRVQASVERALSKRGMPSGKVLVEDK